MNKKIISIFVLLLSFELVSQEKLSGFVVDTNNNPVPYAHITILDSNRGTISNHLGQFLLTVDPTKDQLLIVSCIGYKTKVIEPLNATEITLQEDVTLLSEVAVTPIDFAKEMVQKAIDKIPENYPEVTEIHTGFSREHAYWDSIRSQPVYVAETVLESKKMPYTKRSNKGVVKLLEGRKYEDAKIDSLPVRFFGGSHDAHELDIVAKRTEFLSNLKKFEFDLVDTLKYDSKHVYKIDFVKQNTLSGSVFIIDSSYAILKADFNYKTSDITNGKRKFENYSVEYEKHGETWRLKRTIFETAFNFPQRELFLFAEYATTNIRNQNLTIPYTEQIQYGDIFLESTGDYNPDFWKNYDIIVPDELTDSLFKNSMHQNGDDNEKASIEKSANLREFLKKLRSSFSLDYSLISINSYSLAFENSQFAFDETIDRRNQSTWGLSSMIQYEFKKSWFVGIKSTISLSKPSNSTLDLQLLKQINLNPKGRPILISPALSFGYQQLFKSIGNFQSESEFSVNGKNFDSGSTDILVGQRGFRLMPTLSFGIEKSHRLQYYVSAGYNIQVDQKIGLIFDETDQFFLKQKKTFLRNGNEGLTIVGSEDLLKNNWNFTTGIYLSF